MSDRREEVVQEVIVGLLIMLLRQGKGETFPPKVSLKQVLDEGKRFIDEAVREAR